MDTPSSVGVGNIFHAFPPEVWSKILVYLGSRTLDACSVTHTWLRPLAQQQLFRRVVIKMQNPTHRDPPKEWFLDTACDRVPFAGE